jgi:hypothetical protein
VQRRGSGGGVGGVVRWCLHEGVIDGDHKDFASFLKLGVGDVAWDMGVGACWT